jgi:hypothetical protein
MFLSLQLFLFLKSVMDTTNGWQFGKPLPDRINYMLQKQKNVPSTLKIDPSPSTH